MDDAVVITLIALGIPLFWMAIMLAIGRFGGWSALAEYYRAQDDFQGQRWRFESARFRWANYSGCLTFGANARGMHISTFFLFRPGHPPLFIPWGDVSMKKTSFWRFPYAELRFRREPERPVVVREKLGHNLATAAGLPWPPAEAKWL